MSGLYKLPAFFLVALCHAVVICHMAEHKYSRKKFLLYSLLYIVCFAGVGTVGFPAGGTVAFWAYVVIVLWTFLYSCIISRDCFPKKCFLFITYFGLFSVLDNVLKLMIGLFLPDLSEMVGYYAAIVLRSIILLLLLALYQKYAAAVFRSLTVSAKRWWNLALIALLFYLLQVAVSFANTGHFLPDGYLLLAFAAISFVMCAVYGVVFSNISYMKKDAEVALIRQNAEYLSERLSALQNAAEAGRRLRHDMRHHIDTIAAFAKSGDTAAILSYIGEYGNEISEAALKQYSVNRTVNSILSVYAGKASECGVHFSVRCNVPEKLSVREIDLIALLGNLLENALHGCQESESDALFIKIHIRLQNDRLLVLCDNTCQEYLQLVDGLPAFKSIGVSSILSVCEKYDGNLDYKVEDGNCSVCAILHLT